MQDQPQPSKSVDEVTKVDVKDKIMKVDVEMTSPTSVDSVATVVSEPTILPPEVKGETVAAPVLCSTVPEPVQCDKTETVPRTAPMQLSHTEAGIEFIVAGGFIECNSFAGTCERSLGWLAGMKSCW